MLAWLSALLLAHQAVLPLEIPRRFWGEYNEQLTACGTGNHDSRLRVSWDRVHFYESVGELVSLLRHEDGSVTVEAKHEGEGQVWTAVYNLRLSADDQSLTVTNPQTRELVQHSMRRLRCPAQ
jgi:hypothetical protein